MKEKKKKVRYIKPPNILKKKVGSGGVDEKILDKTQLYLEAVDLDFAPYALQFLETMRLQITRARQSQEDFIVLREALIMPVMQLKANGGMFRYPLLSDVADIALQFLDDITDINPDTLDVLDAHHNTILVIMKNGLKGHGGVNGKALVEELERACERYFAKHAKV